MVHPLQGFEGKHTSSNKKLRNFLNTISYRALIGRTCCCSVKNILVKPVFSSGVSTLLLVRFVPVMHMPKFAWISLVFWTIFRKCLL